MCCQFEFQMDSFFGFSECFFCFVLFVSFFLIWWNRSALEFGADGEEEDGPFELRVLESNEAMVR